MEFVARTDIGIRRSENQDSVCVFAHAGCLVGIVADGMGGHNGGATASRMAVACLKEKLLAGLRFESTPDEIQAILRDAYTEANAQIYALSQAEEKLQGMGTTLVVAVLKDGNLLVSNIGDSRAYLTDDTGIRQLTVDQTLVQRLVDSGQITKEAAKLHPHRNVILEAVGTSETISPEFYAAEAGGTTVLLCSDGLSGEIEDATMLEILNTTDSVAQAAQDMIAQANAAGGKDNITVVLLRAQRGETAKG